MSLFRTAAKSSPRLIQIARQHQWPASVIHHSQNRLLSTGTQQPNQDAAFGPFSQTPSSGVVYAKLRGTTSHASKADVLNLFTGCNLSIDDIKHQYDWNYMPLAVLVRFPSLQAYNAGIRSIKGRYRLDLDNGSRWDSIAPYDGKALLLQGIPPNAIVEDIERFLSGCTYDASSMQFVRPSSQMPSRSAVVRFPSQALAMHAFITKNRGFCLNNQILIRVLY